MSVSRAHRGAPQQPFVPGLGVHGVAARSSGGDVCSEWRCHRTRNALFSQPVCAALGWDQPLFPARAESSHGESEDAI